MGGLPVNCHFGAAIVQHVDQGVQESKLVIFLSFHCELDVWVNGVQVSSERLNFIFI